MSGDYKEAQGVKTQRDNEFKIKVVDGQSGATATKQLTVAQNGDTIVPGTNDLGVPIFGKTSDGKLRLLALDAAGNVQAVIGNPAGAAVVSDYSVLADVTTAQNHDVVITSGKTATKLAAAVSSEGLVKWQLGLWDGAAFTPYATRITSPAQPWADFSSLQMPVGDGTAAVRLIALNLEATSVNCYSTIEFIEE